MNNSYQLKLPLKQFSCGDCGGNVVYSINTRNVVKIKCKGKIVDKMVPDWIQHEMCENCGEIYYSSGVLEYIERYFEEQDESI